ncbi:MAG: hypothetical protein R3E94_03705 [Burkholderiaceae bacterium]
MTQMRFEHARQGHHDLKSVEQMSEAMTEKNGGTVVIYATGVCCLRVRRAVFQVVCRHSLSGSRLDTLHAWKNGSCALAGISWFMDVPLVRFRSHGGAPAWVRAPSAAESADCFGQP